METKTLNEKSRKMAEKYLSMPELNNLPCPYFNNKKITKRFGLRSQIGKGLPEEIAEEVEVSAMASGINLKQADKNQIKKFLLDRNIGIDCSGLVFQILNIENENQGFGKLGKKLKFSGNFVRQIIGSFRPAENTSVSTFEENSKEISLKEILPGDFIIALNQKNHYEKNHIILILETKTENENLKEIVYLHAIAWKKDGLFGGEVGLGEIFIKNPDFGLLDQIWQEKDRVGPENETYAGLQSAETVKIKRLNWF